MPADQIGYDLLLPIDNERRTMFGTLFKPQSPLPEETIEWLFNAYAWALQTLGSDVFFNKTQLIEPNNQFFPGKGENPQEMAELIFKRVQDYCGLNYWPCRVVDHHQFDGDPSALPDLRQTLQATREDPSAALTLLYEPQQLTNPNAMIANYVQGLAHNLVRLAGQPIPCDPDQYPHLLELIGTYMGFGIMFTNTAVAKQARGCGSCCNTAAERQGAMTEMEELYAMAIFCVAKEIPMTKATPHIKGYLKSLWKKAYKDAERRTEQLAMLKAIESPSRLRGENIQIEFQPA